jgi:hypothetical protein
VKFSIGRGVKGGNTSSASLTKQDTFKNTAKFIFARLCYVFKNQLSGYTIGNIIMKIQLLSDAKFGAIHCKNHGIKPGKMVE